MPGICAVPYAIEAITTTDGVDALKTGDVFRWFNPRKGLVCLNSDQVSHFFSQIKSSKSKINYFFLNFIFFRLMVSVRITKCATFASAMQIMTTQIQVNF